MALKYLYVPSGYKSGTAYGVLPNDSTADFDEFQRESTATRTNKDGLIELMGSNIPRIDYSDGGCPSLLLEIQRTNKCRASESINSWNKNPSSSAVTIRENDEISPDGKMTADVVSVFTEFDGVLTPSMVTVINSTYSCSAYVKHVSGNPKIRFGISPNFHSGTGGKYVRFDLSDGSLILDGLAGVGEFKSVYVGNGWYRLMIENILVPSNAGGDSSFIVYSFEEAFTEFAVWGGQIEVGDYTSSYIPNLNTSVGSQTTKRGDAGKFAGNFEFNSNEGVLEVRFKAFPISSGDSSRITFGATDQNRVMIGYTNSGQVVKPLLLIKSPLTDQSTSVSMPSSFNIFDYNTYQLKFQSGNNELKVNGELVNTGSSDTFKNLTFLFDEALRNISLNYYSTSTSQVFYGGIQHIKIYDSVTDF
jgi:hypothetical protein